MKREKKTRSKQENNEDKWMGENKMRLQHFFILWLVREMSQF